MAPNSLALLIAVVLAAGAHLVLEALGVTKLATKPIPLALIMLLLWSGPAADDGQRILVFLALICSLVGDIALALERDRFALGLGAFLIAHCFFIAAFSRGISLDTGQLAVLAPFLLFAATALAVLWKKIPPRLLVAVAIYALSLAVMAWCAELRRELASPPNKLPCTLGAIGALLFLISDSLIGARRFHRPFRGAQTLILSTYFAAQTLFALSVSAPTPR